ncbi:hypothetical protein Lgee_1652, partial [Legionella geestiana]
VWLGANAWNDSAWSRYKNTRESTGAEKMSRTQGCIIKRLLLQRPRQSVFELLLFSRFVHNLTH